MSRVLRALLPIAALIAAPLQAQTVQVRAGEFATAWAEANLEPVKPLFAETIRLTMEGRSHTGVRPTQVLAALTPILDAHEPAAPTLVRLQEMGDENESAFAEYRWDSTNSDTGAPIGYTLLLIFERAESSWAIVELRVMP